MPQVTPLQAQAPWVEVSTTPEDWERSCIADGEPAIMPATAAAGR